MKAIKHGTRAGYQAHLAIRGMPCQACAKAQSDYMREYQKKNYDPAKRRARYLRAKAAGYYSKESV